jgi:hypothetical protein
MQHMPAVNVRLGRDDVQLLGELGQKLRTSQAAVITMALRHLGESVRRGQPIYVAVEGEVERVVANGPEGT